MKLTELPWTEASAGWGEVSREVSPSGRPMVVAGRKIPCGIAAHARSLVEFPLPSDAVRFRAQVAIDDGALTQASGATARFFVHALPAAAPAESAGVPVPVSLAELGLTGSWRIRDLWRRSDIGIVDRQLEPVVPWHGAVLLRLTKVR